MDGVDAVPRMIIAIVGLPLLSKSKIEGDTSPGRRTTDQATSFISTLRKLNEITLNTVTLSD